jgi:hypothetical protein
MVTPLWVGRPWKQENQQPASTLYHTTNSHATATRFLPVLTVTLLFPIEILSPCRSFFSHSPSSSSSLSAKTLETLTIDRATGTVTTVTETSTRLSRPTASSTRFSTPLFGKQPRSVPGTPLGAYSHISFAQTTSNLSSLCWLSMHRGAGCAPDSSYDLEGEASDHSKEIRVRTKPRNATSGPLHATTPMRMRNSRTMDFPPMARTCMRNFISMQGPPTIGTFLRTPTNQRNATPGPLQATTPMRMRTSMTMRFPPTARRACRIRSQ